MVTVRNPVQDDSQADGILRYMLNKGKASRKQVAWLLGYVKRLRDRDRPQGN